MPGEVSPLRKPRGTAEVEGNQVGTMSYEFRGVTYTLREITVEENDNAIDASRNADGSWNNRTMTRLLILTSIVEPKLTIEGITKLPNKLYQKLVDLYNDLNDPDKIDEASADPSDSAPATSDEQS